MKHGYKPTLGITRHLCTPAGLPYYSYRVGFYFFCIEYQPQYLAIMYKRRPQFVIEWGIEYKPFIRFTTWKNNLIYKKDRDVEFDLKTGKIIKAGYFWKKLN